MELAQEMDFSGIEGDDARICVHQEGATLVDTHTLTAAVLPAHRLTEKRIARAPRGQDLGQWPAEPGVEGKKQALEKLLHADGAPE